MSGWARFAIPAVAAFLLARPAAAWDPDVHAVILQGARRLSPEFRARLEHLPFDDVVRGSSNADRKDLFCASHRLVSEPNEAWTRAAQILEELRGRTSWRATRAEAELVGQYFHYVADCAAPRVILGSRAGTMSVGAYDVAVFRLRRPLTEPVLDALKARARQAEWADPVPEAGAAALRDAINLTIEASALLPPPRGRAPVVEPADAPSPVIYTVMSVVQFSRAAEDRRVTRSGDPVHEKWAEALVDVIPSTGGRTYARVAERGVHVLEWVPRTEPGGGRVRALFLNNQGVCAVRVDVYVSAKLLIRVPASLAPLSLTVVEFPAPASSPDDVGVWAVRGACPAETRKDASAQWTYAYRMTGSWLPDFGAPGREIRIMVPTPDELRYNVDFDPADVAAELKGLWIREFTVRPEREAWSFRIEGSVVKPKGYIPRPMQFVVEITGDSGQPVRRDFRIEPGTNREGALYQVSVPDQTQQFRNPRFRLVSVRRQAAP